MISQPNHVRVWASQFAIGDFPPVCALSGRPAETRRKFRFSTPPPWAYALLLLGCLGGLGFVLFAIVFYAVSDRADGFLPLTRANAQVAAFILWSPIVLFGGFMLFTGGGIALVSSNDQTTSGVGAVLFFVAILLLLGAILLRLVATPLALPRGKVDASPPGYADRIVEIWNLNPTFVAALNQMQQSRSAQVGWQAQFPIQP